MNRDEVLLLIPPSVKHQYGDIDNVAAYCYSEEQQIDYDEKEYDRKIYENIKSKKFISSEERHNQSRENARTIITLVSSIDDVQKQRIMMGNRLISNFRSKLDLDVIPTEGISTEEKKYDEKEKLNLISNLVNEYKSITEVAKVTATGNLTKKNLSEAISDKGQIISSKFEYDIIESYVALELLEDKMNKTLEEEVYKHPIWDNFLKGVKGCGPKSAGIIIAKLDPYKARHCASFWRYCGLDVVYYENNKGDLVSEGRGKKHAKDNMVDYVDDNGDIKQKASLGYNPVLKSKLVGVMADTMIKAKSEYTEYYYNNKNRLIIKYSHGIEKGKHIYDKNEMNGIKLERRAKRYMIKMFLRDLWVAWRKLEGLEVTEPYEVQYLGKRQHGLNYTETILKCQCGNEMIKNFDKEGNNKVDTSSFSLYVNDELKSCAICKKCSTDLGEIELPK